MFSTPFIGEGGSRFVGHRPPAGAIYHLPLRPNEADLPAASDYYSSFASQHNLHSLKTLPAAFSMAAYQSHQDELAQLQELSNNYEPEATVMMKHAPLSCLLVLICSRDRW